MPDSMTGFYTTIPWPNWQWTTCNCACAICMSGGCCLAQTGGTWPTTVTGAGTGPLLPVHEHDYRKFDPATLFCRTCGELKAVK